MSRDVAVNVPQIDRAESVGVGSAKSKGKQRGALEIVGDEAGLLLVSDCLVQPASDVVVICSLVALNSSAARRVGIGQEVQIVFGNRRDEPGRDNVVREILTGDRVHKLYRVSRKLVVGLEERTPIPRFFSRGWQQAQLVGGAYELPPAFIVKEEKGLSLAPVDERNRNRTAK